MVAGERHKVHLIYSELKYGFINKINISVQNTRSTRFLFHFIGYFGDYEPTCIVTVEMVTM